MRWYQPASHHYGFRQLASEESCNKEVWSRLEGELKHIVDHLTHRWIAAKKPKSSCHLKLYRLRTDDGNNNDKKNNSFHNQGKNGALVIHFLPSSGAFYRVPERLPAVLPFSFLTWLRSLRGRKNVCVWQTWQGFFLRVLKWSSLKFMFSGLFQKHLVKEVEVWKKVFSRQYCHTCQTRFAVLQSKLHVLVSFTLS